MKLNHLKNILEENPNKNISFFISDHQIPQHFHLTEVGIENKVFIDCGGTTRNTHHCTLQLWVANDTDHRLNSTKMLDILLLSNKIIDNDNVDIRIEYEKDVISQYPIKDYQISDDIIFNLQYRHTECLAPEKCGVSCCEQPLINII